MRYRKALKILEATLAIEANHPQLLPSLPLKKEVKSLLTDFRKVEEIPFSSHVDGCILIENAQEKASYERIGNKVKFRGPFLRLNDEASDLRFGLWGNQGFLYRFVLYLLEKKHHIYNFHACALYQQEKDRLLVIMGGAGSGKTVCLLSGLTKGLKLYSTETVHFRLRQKKVTWFMGSVFDNVRWGTLIHHFPQFLPEQKTPQRGKEWQHKTALDLSPFQHSEEKLVNPRSVTILFPRIEEGRKGFLFYPVKDSKKAAKALFDNLSQKLVETTLLYDHIPVLGLEEKKMAESRLRVANNLVHHETLTEIAYVLSNPSDCWGNLLS
ncbi:MAG: hypothetical protein ACLFVG_07825 [Candidatus Aminicenantes bacterium]